MTGEEWIGKTIGGKYRVESVLGKGGMGVVLRARHLRLDEPVAIKILLTSMMEVPGMVARFMREARAASKIKSPHVVRVVDVDALEDGVPYMVMEYLEGTDLAALRRKQGPFEIPEAARFLLEACDAIAEAHSLGIVHRDLKPANLFLARGRDGSNVLKVLDFGISKLDAPSEEDTTKTGQMMGSPKYMSPEQMLSMHDVDGRSDIWSLGAILYELVTGRPPFLAESAPRVCALVLNEKPEPPSTYRPDLPQELEAVILRCLEKDPNNRFPNVAEFVSAFAHFAPGDISSRINIAMPRLPLPPMLPRTGPEDRTAETARARPTESVSPAPVMVRGATTWNGSAHGSSASGTRLVAGGMAVAALLAIGVGGLALHRTSAASNRDPMAPDALTAPTVSTLHPTVAPTAAEGDGGAQAGKAAARALTEDKPPPEKVRVVTTSPRPVVPAYRGPVKPAVKPPSNPTPEKPTPPSAGNLFPGRQ